MGPSEAAQAAAGEAAQEARRERDGQLGMTVKVPIAKILARLTAAPDQREQTAPVEPPVRPKMAAPGPPARRAAIRVEIVVLLLCRLALAGQVALEERQERRLRKVV